MPVAIVNKIPDLRERDEINLIVDEMLDSSPISWNVRVLPAPDNDNIQLRMNALDQDFSATLLGTDSNRDEGIRTFIRRALEAAEGGTSPKKTILQAFELLSGTSAGIESWITPDTDEQVFIRLGRIESDPLSKVQLDQLLLLAHEAGVSDGFFRYYWLTSPVHPYDVTSIPGYRPDFLGGETIKSLGHLLWGLHRLYVDTLLFFANIRSGYRWLRSLEPVSYMPQ